MVPLCVHLLPVVDGVAPELTVGTEAVGGTAGHRRGTAAGVQLEELGVGPDVGGIQGHIDGHVADDPDAVAVGVGAQGLPLAEKFILQEILEADARLQLLPVGLHDGLQPHEQTHGPGLPVPAPEMLLDGHKEGVILQPEAVVPDKFPVILRFCKTAVGNFQEPDPLMVQQAKVHPVLAGAPAHLGRLFGQQKPLLHQRVQIDQIVVARKGGEGLVGAVAVARGIQGQNLPVALTGSHQKVHEIIGRLTHAANAIGPRQRGNVHQNTAFTHI